MSPAAALPSMSRAGDTPSSSKAPSSSEFSKPVIAALAIGSFVGFVLLLIFALLVRGYTRKRRRGYTLQHTRGPSDDSGNWPGPRRVGASFIERSHDPSPTPEETGTDETHTGTNVAQGQNAYLLPLELGLGGSMADNTMRSIDRKRSVTQGSTSSRRVSRNGPIFTSMTDSELSNTITQPEPIRSTTHAKHKSQSKNPYVGYMNGKDEEKVDYFDGLIPPSDINMRQIGPMMGSSATESTSESSSQRSSRALADLQPALFPTPLRADTYSETKENVPPSLQVHNPHQPFGTISENGSTESVLGNPRRLTSYSSTGVAL